MNYADRVKDTASTTGTGAITLSGSAPSGFKTFGSAFGVGVTFPYCIVSSSGEWEIGYGTMTSSTSFSRDTVLSSSNSGAAVSFSAGTKDVFCTLTAADISAFCSSGDIAFSTTIPLAQLGLRYMPQTAVSGALTFSHGGAPVKGSEVYLRLVADGTNVPDFTAFKEWGGSLGYDNRVGIINQIVFFYDGYDYWYSVSQAVNAQPLDVVPPTAVSAVVQDASATTLTITMSETMDTSFVPSASAFAVSGHTVSAAAVSSGTIVLTVSAFVNGEAARTASYTQPGTNQARDISGNLLASFSGLSVTNNVGVVATVPGAPTIGTATAGNGSASVPFTAPGSNGGSTILDYTATSSPGGLTGTLSGAGSGSITVSGLTNGTAYTFTVKARNAVGSSAASSASNSVTPSSSSFIRLDSLGGGATESGNSTTGYSYASIGGGGWNAGGASSQSIVADGFVAAVVGNYDPSSQEDCMVGLQPGATWAGYATYAFAIWTDRSAVAYSTITSGSPGAHNGATVVPAVGDVVRVRRVGTTVYGEVSKDSGSTWTVVNTWTGTSAGTLHPAIVLEQAGRSISAIYGDGLS
jgi:Fibronectin type III domain